MKSTGIFIGALIGLSFLVSTAMLVTATMKPQWFMFGAKPAQADSLQAHGTADSLAMRDSSHALQAEHGAAPATQTEPSAATQPAEPQQAAAEKDKKEPAVAASAAPAQALPSPAAKEDDLQNLVKLYEAMKPQDAAKILGKLQDKEIRAIVLHVKKKQAAKILSYFDANRAAQILSQ
jgi:hypothetical protein